MERDVACRKDGSKYSYTMSRDTTYRTGKTETYNLGDTSPRTTAPRTPQLWSDYSRTRFHAQSLHEIKQHQYQNELVPFDTYTSGRALGADMDFIDTCVDGDFRHFAEASDSLEVGLRRSAHQRRWYNSRTLFCSASTPLLTCWMASAAWARPFWSSSAMTCQSCRSWYSRARVVGRQIGMRWVLGCSWRASL